MNQVLEKNKCSGCSACMNICPKDAIQMVEDDEGFKYPIINHSKCVNCNLCKKTCPILNKKEENLEEITAYACINKNTQERLNSSSGGVFILLAKEILKRNGVVFGVAFNDRFEAVHDFVENEKDLDKLMRSKYTQSDIKRSYKKVKEFLDNDRYVLFTGTPCQVEGLLAYLGKKYDKLYTQDIICHGVPSPKVWRKYLEFQIKKNKDNIKNISFRNKDKSWNSFRMKISFENRTYAKDTRKDIFLQAFLKNTILRESCYNCSFKDKYRKSDITIADYWGVDKIHPKLDDDKGTSLVIINSDKGSELFENIKDNIVYEKTDFEYAISVNTAMTKSAPKDKKRDDFFKNIDKMPFDKLVNKYVSKENFIQKYTGFLKKICKKTVKTFK